MRKVIEILDIRILKTAEYFRYKSYIPISSSKEFWVLEAADRFRKNVNIITEDIDEKNQVGIKDRKQCSGVRPVLTLRCKDYGWKQGDRVNIGGVAWTVLTCYSDAAFVISNDIIANRIFDTLDNRWGLSQLRDWLREWVEYLVQGLDDVVYITKEGRLRKGSV